MYVVIGQFEKKTGIGVVKHAQVQKEKLKLSIDNNLKNIYPFCILTFIIFGMQENVNKIWNFF